MAKRGRPRKGSSSSSLIDWQEPENNAHVLDWRERAHEFGLVPAGTDDEPETVVLPADRLIDEDEPEAYRARRPGYDQEPDDEESPRARQEEEERFEAGVSREDLDLVRLYLKTVGQRKLLTAKQEQEIGRRSPG